MNAIMNMAVQAMLLWSWQALLLMGLVMIGVRIGPMRSASARYSFWLFGVLVISVLPVANTATGMLPLTPPVLAPITEIAQLPVLAVQALPLPTVAESSSPSTSDFLIPTVFSLWVAGVCFTGFRSLRARLRWKQLVALAARVEQADLPVPLGYSAAVDVPVLVGVLRPMILLPAGIENWTSAEELRAVVLHEMAHVEQRDHWWSVVQGILGAIFFFHPGVRYALRQLIIERELAADEHVLASGASRTSYAEVILKVAEHTIPGRRTDCPAFHPSAKILERRIDMILNHQPSTQSRRTLATATRFVLVLGFAALLLPDPAMTAEMPLAASEIRLAGIQPVMPEMPEAASAEPEAQAPTPAQAAVGTVSGTVSDQSGAVVPGVTITLDGAAGRRVVVTNEAGRYVLPQVPEGQYTLQARLPGFIAGDSAVSVTAGSTAVQNIGLQLARVMTMVEVSASRVPAVQAAPQNPRPAPVRVGGDVAAPSLVFQVKPIYPPAARAAGLQDMVRLNAVIGVDGSVLSLQLDQSRPNSGNAEFIKAATDAVQQWRYRPGLLNGVPLQVETTITVYFSLTD